MSFSDPQSLTITGVNSGSAVSLPRVSSGTNASTYRSGDGTEQLLISHSYGKRQRRMFRVDFKKIAADPFASGVNREFVFSAWLAVDTPLVGFTIAEQKAIVDGVLASLSASSGAKITSLLGGEN